jgi:hypothetical protein
LTGLIDYLSLLLNQNYQSIDKILNLTWEDLEEIGVKKLGTFRLKNRFFMAVLLN